MTLWLLVIGVYHSGIDPKNIWSLFLGLSSKHLLELSPNFCVLKNEDSKDPTTIESVQEKAY